MHLSGTFLSHEPFRFLSGTCRGSQQRGATLDREGFTIVSTAPRLEYLLWREVRIYSDHHNLAHIFEIEAFVGAEDCGAVTRVLLLHDNAYIW